MGMNNGWSGFQSIDRVVSGMSVIYRSNIKCNFTLLLLAAIMSKPSAAVVSRCRVPSRIVSFEVTYAYCCLTQSRTARAKHKPIHSGSM
jgi:hypothetical protein